MGLGGAGRSSTRTARLGGEPTPQTRHRTIGGESTFGTMGYHVNGLGHVVVLSTSTALFMVLGPFGGMA